MQLDLPRRLQVACEHDLLVTGLRGVLAPSWEVRRVRGVDELTDDLLLVDVDDPGHASLLEVPLAGRTVAWSWRSAAPGASDTTMAGWLRKGASSASIVAAFDRLEPPVAPREHDHLSFRELEVLQGLVDSLSNDELGERLFLSTNTIKTHVRNVYRKTGTNQRSGAVVWAMMRGMRPGGSA